MENSDLPQQYNSGDLITAQHKMEFLNRQADKICRAFINNLFKHNNNNIITYTQYLQLCKLNPLVQLIQSLESDLRINNQGDYIEDV